ncbi:hypothetical protein BDV10DRAFT_166711 [Aspergillus recurvatus]
MTARPRLWPITQANWHAARLLGQLNGSTSFAGTIELALALRHRDSLMAPILFLWVMSLFWAYCACEPSWRETAYKKFYRRRQSE